MDKNGDRKMNIKRYIRGVKFLLTYLIVEKPKGLDFSMRNRTKGVETKGNHGYALTQEKAFDNIMTLLEIDKNDNFIDIGCGKGGVLRYAVKYDFGRVAGLEIEDNFYEIAVNNFRKLKMENIELFHDNAITFSHYDEFNVYFFFNPFDKDIYQLVLDNIFESIKKSKKEKVILICYGASVPEYIQATNMFSIVADYTDQVRGTSVCIWKLNTGGGYIPHKVQLYKLKQLLIELEIDFSELEDSVVARTNGNFLYNGDFNYLATGNSITQHDPSNVWPGSWGATASASNKDYFHLVVNGLNAAKGKTAARCVYFPSWETLATDRAETILNIDSLISNNLDLVTIQLGENVSDNTTYEAILFGRIHTKKG